MLELRQNLGPEWRLPPAAPDLPPDELHLWLFSLAPPVERQVALAALLSADERERADRFHLERDRRRFQVARGALRAILGRYLGTSSAALTFAYGPRGKPALARPWAHSRLRFNLSHSGELGLLGLAHDRELGVDVELARPVEELARLARRFFSPAEVAALAAVPPAERAAAFFAGWTRKEAFIKATGDGLARPLADFSVSLAPGEPAALLAVAADPDAAGRWTITGVATLPGYAAAVAAEGSFRLAQFVADEAGEAVG
jgi:4'-phosphopantetheinyl transferase